MPTQRMTREYYRHTCTRCGHEWTSEVEKPKRCANRGDKKNAPCKSKYWDRERR